MHISIQKPSLNTAAYCEPILDALPQWFGIPSANRQFLIDINENPTLLARVETSVVGFLTLKMHNLYSSEIHVMGIMPEYHRMGIGTRLMNAAETFLVYSGCEFIQVKTISASDSDPNYARTRAFYEKVGFRPLQEWPKIWGPENPCVQMVKYLPSHQPHE